MAMSKKLRPVLDGARPARGSIRLLAMRASLIALSSVPALVAGTAGVAEGAARRPYYADVAGQGRMPLVHFIRLIRDLPPGFVSALIVGIVIAILGDQIVTAGALKLLDPDRPADEPVRVFQAVFRDGLTHLWAFLRAAFLGLIVSGVGALVIRRVFKKLDVMAYTSQWTGLTSVIRLPMLAAVVFLVWLSTVGAWVFWCRLLTVADGRRYVRRTALLALRVIARHPLRTWGLFVLLSTVSTLASALVLIAWRQAEPKSSGGALGWAIVWLIAILGQAFVWLWLARSGRLLYAGSERLAVVKASPDEPLRILRRIRGLVRRRSASSPPPASPSATA